MRTDAVVILCSRPESSRIQRKPFANIAGRSAIEHCLSRCVQTGLPIILAVPTDCHAYDSLVLRDSRQIQIFRGNPDSPLHRMSAALLSMKETPMYVVRVTHDDILVDAQTVLELIDAVKKEGTGYGITPDIIGGAGVEVIHRDNLLAAAATHTLPTEYVSYFVKGRAVPGETRHKPRQGVCRPYRLELDYPEDLTVLRAVLRATGPDAPLEAIARFLDNRPYILDANKMPSITFYTCALNAGRWIYDAMNSVFSNSGIPDFEYLIVDDGSTDDTLAEAMRYCGDKRVRYLVLDKNVGLASASNIAVNAAKGRYVMRVDADDMLAPVAARDMVKLADEYHPVAIYPKYIEVDEMGAVISNAIPGDVHHHAGGTLMDRRVLNEIRFRDGLRHWDSHELHDRLKKVAGRDLMYYDEIGFMYRRHPDSLSQDRGPLRGKLAIELGVQTSGSKTVNQ